MRLAVGLLILLAALLPRAPAAAAETGLATLPLQADGPPLRAVYNVGSTYGSPSSGPHYVAVERMDGGAWREVGRVALDNLDDLEDGAVTQVQVAPGDVWIEVDGLTGAHSGRFELLRFDGQALHDELSNLASHPGVGEVVDLVGDGRGEAVLDQSDDYVFCYACGVQLLNYAVKRWDGHAFVDVGLRPLADTAPAEARAATARAIDLARAGLWRDALAATARARALAPGDDAARWNDALVTLNGQARADRARASQYPLLAKLFYGDYAGVLGAFRGVPTADAFDPDGPLVKGTAAEGWAHNLAWYAAVTAGGAIGTFPDLAPAYYVRGWAEALLVPGNPAALADLRQAMQLDPSEKLYADGVAYVSGVAPPPPAGVERVAFAPGATSAQVSAELAPGAPRGFVVRVGDGQTIVTDALYTAATAWLLGPDGQPVAATFTDDGKLVVGPTTAGDYTLVLAGSGIVVATVEVPPGA